MIPEIGQLALSLALCISVALGVLPLVGAARDRADMMVVGPWAATGQFVFIAFAFAVLEYAFLTDDFSVLYVASHSSLALPTSYKLVAVWGGHEGSMLFWLLVLSGWTLAVAATNTSRPQRFASRVLGVLGVVSAGFIAFTLFTSNPFARLIPAPPDGIDLNPLLQDPGMVLHPPLLYPGFVGTAVPFAFAVAGLMSRELHRDWARWVRPWVLIGWMFLTAGITLGSAWAYYEIGWGGWWFWDAVENASFMPWLIGAALLHSLAATENRGLFGSWSVLLAIFSLALVLLGGFLTRSGVISSVHSFASDPSRGLFLLVLMLLLIGGALALYSSRAPRLHSASGLRLLSRESFLLANNVLLVVATASILLGTLYPLFIDSLGLGAVAVGRPYFDAIFPLLMLPLAWLLGAGMHSTWTQPTWPRLKRRLKWPAVLSVVSGVVILAVSFGSATVMTAIGVISGIWVIACSLLDPITHLRRRQPLQLPRARWGMLLAHGGLGIFIVGATITSTYSIETDRAMRPGDRFELAPFELVFKSIDRLRGPNFVADAAVFDLFEDGEWKGLLQPQRSADLADDRSRH
jgi:cytochrome c-type biogenesis protein CcmF